VASLLRSFLGSIQAMSGERLWGGDFRKKIQLRARLAASAWNFLTSILFLFPFAILVFFHWYPAPLDSALGVGEFFWLFFLTTLALSSTCIAVVFKINKRKLFFDLMVIVLIQTSIFYFGAKTIAQGRPAFLVFVIDDFELVREMDIRLPQDGVIPFQYRVSLWRGTQIVAAAYSEDSKIRGQQQQDELLGGISLARDPQAYVLLSTQRAKIRSKGHELSELRQFNEERAIERILGLWPSARAWLPLKATKEDKVVLVTEGGDFLAVVDLRPWMQES